MNKIIVCIGIILSLTMSVNAQEGICFHKGTWEEIKTEAIKQDKLIL